MGTDQGIYTSSGMTASTLNATPSYTVANGSLRSNNVNKMHEFFDGSYYFVFAATDGGLSIFSDSSGDWITLTTDAGLMSNDCESVYYDSYNGGTLIVGHGGGAGLSLGQ